MSSLAVVWNFEIMIVMQIVIKMVRLSITQRLIDYFSKANKSLCTCRVWETHIYLSMFQTCAQPRQIYTGQASHTFAVIHNRSLL